MVDQATERFTPAERPPMELREQYLDLLPEPQELFLEQLVNEGGTWALGGLAHVVVNAGAIVEFHCRPGERSLLDVVFDAALAVTGATSALCKSYDTPLLVAALARPATVRPVGHLFRRMVNIGPLPVAATQLAFHPAGLGDVERIAALDDGFFDGRAEIARYADRDGLFVASAAGSMIGCGLMSPVVAGRREVDIGMWVAPAHRGHGYSAGIVAFLRRRVESTEPAGPGAG